MFSGRALPRAKGVTRPRSHSRHQPIQEYCHAPCEVTGASAASPERAGEARSWGSERAGRRRSPASGGCVAPWGERSEPPRAGRWAGTRAAPRSATGGNREPGRGVGLPTRGALARNDDRRTQPISYFPRGVYIGHQTSDGHDSSAHPRRMRIIAGRRDKARRSCYLVRCLTRRAGRGVRSVQPLPTCDRAGRVEILPRREW